MIGVIATVSAHAGHGEQQPPRTTRRTACAGAVHVRARAIACRSSADGDIPAASALSCQAACSAGVTRAATVTVRRSSVGAPAAGFGGRPTPPVRCSGSSATSWGF